MSSNFITIEQLRTVLDEKLAPLKTDVSELRGKLDDTMAFLDMANAKYEEVMSKLSQHEEERKVIIAENKILKTTIQTMEGKLKQVKESNNEIEQYSRRECLEIQGIPLPIDGKSENTNDIVIEIGNQIGVDITEEDISVSHRLPVSKKYKGKIINPTIIVKFLRRDTKELYYRARKTLRNITTEDLGYTKSNKIFINESLTEANKELFRECVKVKKDLQYNFIWTSNGKILLRKDQTSSVVYIRNKDDINKLLSR